ncbi:MAG: hypothetical protein P4N60_13290 [Verrucomicrobiae bacterium]|nr:hypothetical protein [Verrucomicrobiae bacterium]
MRLEQEQCRSKRVHQERRRAGPVGGESGFACTFWEVLIAVVIVALVFGTIFNGYVIGAKRTQWSGYSLAAQALNVQAMEQARSAVWDIAFSKTEITGMNLMNKTLTTNGPNWIMTGYTTNIMDIPWKGVNYVMATNYITVQTIFENGNSNPWVQLQSIRVDTVWPFDGWGNFSVQTYTNSTLTFIAPDNRDPASLGGTD